jgi:purine-binding chemotaxis protein CheW
MTTNNYHDTQPIDWRSIREGLLWDENQQQELLLRVRAAQYASPTKNSDSDVSPDRLTALTFTLGGERYGIDVMTVKAIRPLPKITPVPGVPDFYRGVVNLRGQIITVLDIHRFFNLPLSHETSYQELVIAQSNHLEIGLLTTHVYGIAVVPLNTIQPIESIRYARGVTAEQFVILDIAALFEDERLMIGGQEND